MNSMITASSPIGVFDSGVGGISVLQTLVELFPHENFIYLGDTARLPYGTKSSQTVKKYAEQSLRFLAAQNVKAYVIACNTASSAYLETEFQGRPVYNMIDCGVREILEKSQGKAALLLATKTTVKSQAYEYRLNQSANAPEFISLAAPLFIPLVEEGVLHGPLVTEVLTHTLAPVKNQLAQNAFDTCLLGCTHFPFLKQEIQSFFGREILVVDSAHQLAQIFQQDSKSGRLQINPENQNGRLDFFLTDSSDHFIRFIHQIWPGRAMKLIEI